MQAAIGYIKKELCGIYPETEIDAFIFLLFRHLRSYTRTQFLLSRNEILQEDERARLYEWLGRLKNEEPIQYIIGETEFFGLNFFCRLGVLIPRPETEELVQWILSSLHGSESLLDLGTGTGCIPISIKKNCPGVQVYGCDISETCLELAQNNAANNHADVSFFKMDMLHSDQNGQLPLFDVLVSNPPYVTDREKRLMQRNVLNFEPELALFVPDDDPLLFYKALVHLSGSLLKSGGRMFWEINEVYGNECVSLLVDAGFQNVELRCDINGRSRMVAAQKP